MTIVRVFLIVILAVGLHACAANKKSEMKSVVCALEKVDSKPKNTTQKPSWGYTLSPINVSTEDADGSIYIWHSRISRDTYPTENICMEAAIKGLEYMGGEAWNLEAKCISPHVMSRPIAVTSAEEIAEN